MSIIKKVSFNINYNLLHYLTVLLLSVSVIGCSQSNNTINSKELSKQERIKTLGENVNLHSEILDTEYDLFRTGGFSKENRLGPTDYDYRYVVKVKPDNVALWTKDHNQADCNENNKDWAEELIKHRKENWKTNSKPVCFSSNSRIVVAYIPEGIIFYHIVIN